MFGMGGAGGFSGSSGASSTASASNSINVGGINFGVKSPLENIAPWVVVGLIGLGLVAMRKG